VLPSFVFVFGMVAAAVQVNNRIHQWVREKDELFFEVCNPFLFLMIGRWV
jgi:hypothetical protein